MNSILNDYGQSVIAVGASASIERVKVEHPKLIERLNGLFNCQANIADAVQAIRDAGVRSELETNSLLLASHFGEQCQTNGTTAALVCSVARSNLRLFLDTYKAALWQAHADYPQDYAFPKENLPACFERMEKAIVTGSFNKEGRAFKATCKQLGIKHTYAAINAFIA